MRAFVISSDLVKSIFIYFLFYSAFPVCSLIFDEQCICTTISFIYDELEET